MPGGTSLSLTPASRANSAVGKMPYHCLDGHGLEGVGALQNADQMTSPRGQHGLEYPHRLSRHTHAVDDFVALDIVN
jgi:hypothetical protein